MGLRLPYACPPRCFNPSKRRQKNIPTSLDLLPPLTTMLIVLFIAAAFNNAFSTPVASPVNALDPMSFTILGREIPLPECVNPADNASGQQRNAKEYNKKFNLTPRYRSKLQGLKDWFRRPNDRMTPDRSWGLTHGFLLEMHGLRYFKDSQPFTPTDDAPHPITSMVARKVMSKAHDGLVSRLSQLSKPAYISEDEINDKSKGDFFTKLVVVIQTTWFIVQCVARWVQRLHVTELEIITLAFATLNIITYILWWNKPQNMRLAIPIHDERNNIVEEKDFIQHWKLNQKEASRPPSNNHSFNEQATSVDHSDFYEQHPFLDDQTPIYHRWSDPSYPFLLLKYALLALPRSCWTFVRKISPLRAWALMVGVDDLGNNFYGSSDVIPALHSSTDNFVGEWQVGLALGLIGVLFGGVHLLPIWLSSFSTSVEKYLWIGCSIVILVEPVALSVFDAIHSSALQLSSLFGEMLEYFFLLLFWHVGIFLYAPARLILIVLAFTSLRSLPPSTFVNVEWSSFVPHI
ncbi:hypothetical protein NP233_g7218 [Leucocoprinus birnbaumii]|uniref:Uncharacterized protein n=1 Tax=Leucocoprinus birnbaumii TaxID=56174 RepID=A0AAD5YUU1_9AGAR|nr:hypothetical protein NP233_g7218 [Leucocoprinus birnbaumii]